MIDPRFFSKKEFLTIGRICEILNIEQPKNCFPMKQIIDVATIEGASHSDITFFHNVKYTEQLSRTSAFACIVSKKHVHLVPESIVSLIVDEPYHSLAVLLKEFYSINDETHGSYVSQNTYVSKEAVVEANCHISDFAVVSSGAVVKRGTFIGNGSVILRGVEIGENSYIEPNVTIGYALIGKSAYIKTGARIGQHGFGFHAGNAGITDILQIGRVIIGNNTQIGANCTIDRGSLDDTRIGNHVRIDNMVHIAHNVEIGDYCIIAAQTGIAGSTKIGDRCVFGGQAGITGHLSIGNEVTIAAQSGVMRDIPDKCKVAGSPSVSVDKWRRQTIAVQRLVKDCKK
ncbi:MAG: UDP-3-O-(3-hydroxymyristoyl)glucosamine N-acyltransferase [Holosporales bacterium]|jgi:UDP-3-O-[3-hydroxymyristoyl] glucosamine N-acyltransferase|nr:UDP-3-O-(3-hydroxymyristoyl)glucosamine N-acyltransferase [Holosporales bacterium]